MEPFDAKKFVRELVHTYGQRREEKSRVVDSDEGARFVKKLEFWYGDGKTDTKCDYCSELAVTARFTTVKKKPIFVCDYHSKGV